MKIGLLTFHFADNYGALLQAWALSRYLHILTGEVVFLMNYRPCRRAIRSYFQFDMRKWRFKCAFKQFRKAYFVMTKKCVGSSAGLAGAFDQYWVGSDQVWNPIYFMRHDGIMDKTWFLDFVLPDKKKIAYAASIGEGKWGDKASDIAALMRSFSAISVREDYARENLLRLDINACVVPDPVFLLCRNDYESFADKVSLNSKGRRVFVYGIGEARECVRQACDMLANDKEIVVRAAILNFTFKTKNTPGMTLIYPTPQEWLGEILAADFVITDSFHCSALCLILHCPFRFIRKPLEEKTNDRLDTMFAKLGVHNTENPNWEEVDRRLESYRAAGVEFIRECVND